MDFCEFGFEFVGGSLHFSYIL